MARVPTAEEAKNITESAKVQLEQKKQEFVEQGKEFVPNRAGVMPEEYRTTVPGRTEAEEA